MADVPKKAFQAAAFAVPFVNRGALRRALEAAALAIRADQREQDAQLMDSAGARYQKQVGWPAKASDLLRAAASTCTCTCQIAGAHDPDCATWGPPQEPLTEAEAVAKCNSCPAPATCSEFNRCALEHPQTEASSG